MILVLEPDAGSAEVDRIVKTLEEKGVKVHYSKGVDKTILGLIGDKQVLSRLAVERFSGVEKVIHVSEPFKLAGRSFHPEPSRIQVGNVTIGGGAPVVIAGPCSVESRDQILETARAVKQAGAGLLRGGAFKPRSSPYSFQGLGEEGLKLLAEAGEETGLPVVSEVMDPENLDLVAEYVDILQLGARNMQNFHLLKKVGKAGKPVLLKRGLSATIEEWLMSAEYILNEGNPHVILCERGIRTFETHTRNTLDLSAVPVIRHLSHLPIIVDPSHGTGKWRYVTPMSRAALAAGADGLMVEVHPDPEVALSDGPQSLTLDNFRSMMAELSRPVARIHSGSGT
ncbi:3-deoxy-7-phosphoheptulonate synthase [Kroppenstedtia eburnea]|uniref:3-deoxy-D-arabinoheptulosonate-7-phosphate synthase n=1 Tax=Kroppenstedtia eburnea TaxID=714067 RepID=A0A1N7KGJ6_9BACL|nr:3-deoxy-7-phosphoheptulonate synthase [Kroppenstedtia eburnea]EGK12014.1 3-deoxy-7-phosphoheptulonate synthase [Desmospora sp. 8437]QKI82993.1 3-deoxy-7-phosphoheptulonate synthase [Kroppenstedtia eburnea]SIS60687.1 3-deoxy-D-arabinoheptulosonate-7-phosphate synthase [Kroppenstedtia eburnea]